MSNEKFIGVWKLISLELRNSNGEIAYPMGQDPEGYIFYSVDGFMSVAFMEQGRRRFASNDIRGGTLEERAEAAHGYFSYCGTYEVQEKQIIHHIEVSLIPNWISVDQVRLFEFDNDLLTLSTPPFLVEGKEQTAHLVWKRCGR